MRRQRFQRFHRVKAKNNWLQKETGLKQSVQSCTLALVENSCRNEGMPNKTKPCVFDFLDAAQFLQSYFDWRKDLNKNFSIADWSDELNFGSCVTLRFILKRMRRISARSAEIFKKNLFHSQAEAQCFDTLVAYSQAKTSEERKAFGASLLSLHRQRINYETIDAKIASRNIFGPLVLTLMTFNDFKKTAKNLSYLLRVELGLIESILTEFEKEKVISKKPDGEYEFLGNILKIPDNPDLKKFYEYWIDQSKKALSLPAETRKYRALNFALTREEYQKVLEKLDEYAAGLLNQFNSPNLENRTLYMFESSLFPISERLPEIEI